MGNRLLPREEPPPLQTCRSLTIGVRPGKGMGQNYEAPCSLCTPCWLMPRAFSRSSSSLSFTYCSSKAATENPDFSASSRSWRLSYVSKFHIDR